MEPGPGLTQTEVESLLEKAGSPAGTFLRDCLASLYDDKVRGTPLVARGCDLTGLEPVWVRLGLWATEQAAAGITAQGAEWLGGKTGRAVAALLLRCPGCDRLVAGLRRLFASAQADGEFRTELAAIAAGEREPDLSRLPNDAPDDIRLALALMAQVQDLAAYLPGEFDALHAEMALLRAELARLERIEALVADALAALQQQYEARVAGLEQQRQLDRDTIAAQNAALRALADRAERAEPEPGIEHALVMASRGDTREAEALLAAIGSRKAQEHAGLADAARTAAAEAAAAYRHQGALARTRSVADALAAYRRAAELDPSDCWTWIFVSRLERTAGAVAAAADAATRAHDAAHDQRDLAAASTELGSVREAQGDLAGAPGGLLGDALRPAEAGGFRPRERGLAARPVGELGEAGRRAQRPGRPRATSFTSPLTAPAGSDLI